MSLTVVIKKDHWEITDSADNLTHMVRKDDVSVEYVSAELYGGTELLIKGPDFKEWRVNFNQSVIGGGLSALEAVMHISNYGFTKGLSESLADRIGGTAPVSYVVNQAIDFPIDTSNCIGLELRNTGVDPVAIIVDGIPLQLDAFNTIIGKFIFDAKYDEISGKYEPLPAIVIGNSEDSGIMVTHHFVQL